MGTPLSPPSSEDIFRYRYQHGTNLGAVFVLERWLFGSMYIDGINGDSELDAVNANITRSGLESTRSKWESHWSTTLSDSDLTFLITTAKANIIRLPIGFFTLGPSFCVGTAFDGQPAQAYINAWSFAKTLIQRCHDAGIGVLIDLHALPGGANGDIHSGTSSHVADLWGNGFNLSLASRCAVFIANEAKGMSGVVGIQLCNEAITGAASRGMYDWYGTTVWEINQVNKDIPVYISDAWDLGSAVGFMASMNSQTLNPVIVDTHRYYTFSDFDKSQSPEQILARIPTELSELDGKVGDVFDGKGAVGVFVGEYSCVLDPAIWVKTSPDQIPNLKRQFGTIQNQRWQAKAGGATFWTFKMDWMDGGDWGFKQQVNDGNVVAPTFLNLGVDDVRGRIGNADGSAQGMHDKALNGHVGYWNGVAPGQNFEHWRYDRGWWDGWSDARAFFGARANGLIPGNNSGGDKIGFLDLWVRKRIAESGNMKSQAGFGWEWEQGFRKGLGDFYGVVGV